MPEKRKNPFTFWYDGLASDKSFAAPVFVLEGSDELGIDFGGLF